MATTKPTFAKLKLQKNINTKTVIINEIEIEIKQYLPVEEKLAIIQNVINLSADENNFMNPVKIEVFGTLEIIFKYTNLSFTNKQKENPTELYDLLVGNGIVDKIIAEIPSVEYKSIIDSINETVESIYNYKNSILGILENVSQDYSNLLFDANAIKNDLSDPENLSLLRSVLTKLG